MMVRSSEISVSATRVVTQPWVGETYSNDSDARSILFFEVEKWKKFSRECFPLWQVFTSAVTDICHRIWAKRADVLDNAKEELCLGELNRQRLLLIAGSGVNSYLLRGHPKLE